MTCTVSYCNQGNKVCQFEAEEKALFSFSEDEKKWCFLHLPIQDLKSKPSQKKIPLVEGFGEKLHAVIKESIKIGAEIIDLSYVVFPSGFSLIELFDAYPDYEGEWDLSHCQFYEDIFIFKQEIKTLPKISFKYSAFYCHVTLVNCLFSPVNFDKAHFYNKANFWYSRFTDCTFVGSMFEQGVLFNSCNFGAISSMQGAQFESAEFKGYAGFTDAHFIGKTNFSNVIFNESVDFNFYDNVNKEKADISVEEITFKGCLFHGNVNFNNRIFLSRTDFSECIFFKVPFFHGCTMHQHTIFPGINAFRDTFTEEAPAAYRTLNLAMSNFKARREEAMFYGLEQESLRKTNQFNKVDSVFSWAYKFFANYGQSIARPLMCLFTVFFGGFLSYFILLTPPLHYSPIDWNLLDKIVRLSFHTAFFQIVKPFSIDGFITQKQLTVTHDSVAVFMAGLQSIFSIIFIALLVFAVRWKFKRD